MSARVTKLQLQNEVERLRAECNRLETLVASLQASKAAAPAAPRAPRIIPQREPRQLPAHFAAAREAAMRMGRVMKVGA